MQLEELLDAVYLGPAELLEDRTRALLELDENVDLVGGAIVLD